MFPFIFRLTNRYCSNWATIVKILYELRNVYWAKRSKFVQLFTTRLTIPPYKTLTKPWRLVFLNLCILFLQHRFASWLTTTDLISHNKTTTTILNAVSYEIFVVVSLTTFSLLCCFFYDFSLKQSTSFWAYKSIPELLTGLF